MIDEISDFTARISGEVIAFRRRLHSYPELSREEFATTEAIVERLLVAGLSPQVLAGGTGVVCDVAGKDADRTVALRADIDALAMSDLTDAPYQSRVPGVSHACGHDVHTAVLLGAGLVLQELAKRDLLEHRVRLIFEPAEEVMPGGALDVIAQGWLDRVDAVFGLHCDPKINVGTIGIRTGAMTAAADTVEITLTGPGGHTARPELTVDLLGVVGRVLSDLPTAVRVRVDTNEAFSLVFGSVQSGNAANVIPASAVLRGSVRTTDMTAWDTAEKALTEALAQLLEGTGAQWHVCYTRGVPPVINAPDVTEILRAAAEQIVGAGGVIDTPRSMGGDTFAWLAQAVPGSFARLGTHSHGMVRHDLHASTFDIDESAIAIGVQTLVLAACTPA
ncbi:MAG: amidohydrolase [Candidatus Nanopelagicales bacterium]